MRNTFRFKTGIPHHFALSVMFITSNENVKKSWETVRLKYKENAPVFEWIESILEDNEEISFPMNELGWWKSQLQGH